MCVCVFRDSLRVGQRGGLIGFGVASSFMVWCVFLLSPYLHNGLLRFILTVKNETPELQRLTNVTRGVDLWLANM